MLQIPDDWSLRGRSEQEEALVGNVLMLDRNGPLIDAAKEAETLKRDVRSGGGTRDNKFIAKKTAS